MFEHEFSKNKLTTYRQETERNRLLKEDNGQRSQNGITIQLILTFITLIITIALAAGHFITL